MTTHSSILASRIPMDRGNWQFHVVHGGHKESDTTERLSRQHTTQHSFRTILTYLRVSFFDSEKIRVHFKMGNVAIKKTHL